jgi:hypothetical protein
MALGLLVRFLFVRFLEVSLGGASTDKVELLIFLTISAYLWFFSLLQQTPILLVPYLIGVSAGLVAHFLVRGRTHQRALQRRMWQHLLALIDYGEKPSLPPGEWRVLQLFALQDFRGLEDYFEQYSDRSSTTLIIVRASMERVRGKIQEALDLVNEHLSGNFEPSQYGYLLLLKAQCLGDLQKDVKGMLEILETALARNPNCVGAMVAMALRVAEQIPLLPFASLNPSDQNTLSLAFSLVRRADQLARIDSHNILGGVTGIGLPLTGTSLKDAYAYLALRNGNLEIARAILIDCMAQDSKFASPYLHMGEWFRVAGIESQCDEKTTLRYRTLEKLCFDIAIEFECDKQTLVKHRARQLRDEYLTISTTRVSG